MDRALDAGSSRLGCDAHGLGDLLVRHVEVKAKDENQALIVAQAFECPAQINAGFEVRRFAFAYDGLERRGRPP